MIPDDYRLAMDLLDEGTNRQAALREKHGSSGFKALLTPIEYADLALRLAHSLAPEQAEIRLRTEIRDATRQHMTTAR